MSAWHVRVVAPFLAAVSLVAFGCAQPPEAEKKAADDAVGSAKSAGAERFAKAEFIAMTAAFRKAEAEMTAKSYKEARASYAVAKGLADKAAAAAEASKAAVKADAEQQLAALEQRWKDLQAKGDTGAEKLKAEQKTLWDANAKTVADSLESARAAIAGDASAAKEKLAPIGAQLDKLEASVAAMAAPETKTPAKKK